MGQTADTLIEEQVEWAQDRMIYVAIDHVSNSFDSFPSLGIGMKFVKRSAEKMLVKRMENDIIPEIEDYLDLQLDYINALADADDPDAVHADHQDEVMAHDPFLAMVDAPADTEAEIREESRSRIRSAAEMVASWIEEAGDNEFEDFYDLLIELDKDVDDVERETTSLLFYVDMMEEYRDHLDASVYSDLLSKQKIHNWFLNHFIEGLENGRETVIDEVQEKLEERQEMA